MEKKIEISQADLLKAKEAVNLIIVSPQGAENYRDSATKILAGNEDYSARGSLLVAAFMGLEDLGLNDSDAVDIVAKGLESLGVKVAVTPISPSR
ncbi:hypothetical protein HZB78_03065 [Candidatus Collierbacteria bacterium]|nr:hypothetical protein [Candidatus Collierbacteria bacterium]